MLSFYTKKESTREGVDFFDAGDPRVVGSSPDIVRLQITVREQDDPPKDGKPQPAEEEVHGEH